MAQLVKLADPPALPAQGLDCAWSGDYLVAVHDGTPQESTNKVSFYLRSGDSLTKLTTGVPSIAGTVYCCAWGGDYLVIGYQDAPCLSFLRRDGNSLVSLSAPSPGQTGGAFSCAWSGDYLAVVAYDADTVSLYKRSGDSLTKLETKGLTDYGNDCAWSGDYLAVALDGEPGVQLFRRSGDALISLADAPSAGSKAFSCSWSGDQLAIGLPAVAAQTLAVYTRSGDTLSRIDTITTSPEVAVYDCAWRGNFLAMALGFTPTVAAYEFSGSDFAPLNVAQPLTGVGWRCDWSGNVLAIVGDMAPFLSLYFLDNGSATAQVSAQTLAPVCALRFHAEAPEPEVGRITSIYLCEIQAPGQEPARIPISSFQGRLRIGTPSYLQVVIPDPQQWRDAVETRKHGDLVVFSGARLDDGTEEMVELGRVRINRIADDRGSLRQSLTVSGNGTFSNPNPQTRLLQGVARRKGGTGARVYQAQHDRDLRPGDSVVIPQYGETLVVGMLSFVVDPRQISMEITELI